MRWLMTTLNRCGCLRPHQGQPVCGGEDFQWLSSEPAVDLNYTEGVLVYDRTVVDGGTATAPGATPVDGLHASRPGGQVVDGGGVEGGSAAVGTAPTFDLTECLPEYLRTMHKVVCTTGPVITQKASISTGGAAWIVEWTIVAGDPARYAYPQPIIEGFLDPSVDIPYVGGSVPPGGVWDANGYVTTDPACPVPVFTPVFDPLCPLLVPPPAVPTINPVCFTFPNNYVRRMFTLPKESIPLFWGTVPIITIYTATAEVRNLRIQFFDDPDDDATLDDPCAPEADVVFTYLPPDSVVTFDAVARVIYVDTPGQGRRRADSVAVNSDGGPFSWPEMSCGWSHVVTVDMPQTQVPPVIDVTLVKKAC
jgi:hypothetical protein